MEDNVLIDNWGDVLNNLEGLSSTLSTCGERLLCAASCEGFWGKEPARACSGGRGCRESRDPQDRALLGGVGPAEPQTQDAWEDTRDAASELIRKTDEPADGTG